MDDIRCQNCGRCTSEIRGKRQGKILCPGCSKYPKIEKIECKCGCGEKIFPYDVDGKIKNEYVKGHHLRKHAGIMIKKDGYWMIHLPSHKYCNNKGYVFYHRIILEYKIGRLMKPEEQTHHINGIKTDNAPDNLLCLTAKEHGKYHSNNIKIQ